MFLNSIKIRRINIKKLSIRSVLKCIVLASLFPAGAAAQSSPSIATHHNGWFMYFGNHRISEKLGIHTEYQWRRSDLISGWQQSLLRVGLDWHCSNMIMLSGGYGWIRSYPYGEQPIAAEFDEHRIWQQLILQHNSGRFYFQHRYRLEQRFLQNTGAGTTDTYNFRNRARYRLLLTIPLSRNELKDNTLFAALYDEVFIGFGKGIRKNILDQNRLYLALGWRFSKDCNIQLGYLNHYVIKPDGIRHERNHTLQLSLTYNLDLRKKEKPD